MAAKVVRRGGLVAYPTDTVYGLGCDPFNPKAVEKLIEAKGRGKKPLPVLVDELSSAERIAVISQKARELAQRFWPGPLTIVVPRKPSLPDVVTFGEPKVGVRVPNLSDTIELIRLSGGALIGTSANKSGAPPPRSAEGVVRELGDKVDVILDGGPSPIGVPSTVIDLSQEPPRVLREGAVSRRDLEKVLGKVL